MRRSSCWPVWPFSSIAPAWREMAGRRLASERELQAARGGGGDRRVVVRHAIVAPSLDCGTSDRASGGEASPRDPRRSARSRLTLRWPVGGLALTSTLQVASEWRPRRSLVAGSVRRQPRRRTRDSARSTVLSQSQVIHDEKVRLDTTRGAETPNRSAWLSRRKLLAACHRRVDCRLLRATLASLPSRPAIRHSGVRLDRASVAARSARACWTRTSSTRPSARWRTRHDAAAGTHRCAGRWPGAPLVVHGGSCFSFSPPGRDVCACARHHGSGGCRRDCGPCSRVLSPFRFAHHSHPELLFTRLDAAGRAVFPLRVDDGTRRDGVPSAPSSRYQGLSGIYRAAYFSVSLGAGRQLDLFHRTPASARDRIDRSRRVDRGGGCRNRHHSVLGQSRDGGRAGLGRDSRVQRIRSRLCDGERPQRGVWDTALRTRECGTRAVSGNVADRSRCGVASSAGWRGSLPDGDRSGGQR